MQWDIRLIILRYFKLLSYTVFLAKGLRKAKTWHLDITLANVAARWMILGCLCSFWCFKLCSWLLLPLSWVLKKLWAMMGYDGLWLLDKKATVFKGNGIAHRIAVEWSTWSGCITWRMLQNKMMQNLRTCFNWFILIKQQRKPGRTCDFCDPLLSFFTGAGEVSATSSSSCGSSSVASEWVGMHAFHRNQTALKISKNALKQESQRNQHEPTLT